MQTRIAANRGTRAVWLLFQLPNLLRLYWRLLADRRVPLWPKAVLVGVFTSSLTLALLTVHVLDFPFESALQLSSRDYNETLEKVDHLMVAARPPGSTGAE